MPKDKTDLWKPMPIRRRRRYWHEVIHLLTKSKWVTLDKKKLHWPTLEAIAAYRGFSAKNIINPRNMADVIERFIPPPNF